jgi:hypothetical protein
MTSSFVFSSFKERSVDYITWGRNSKKSQKKRLRKNPSRQTY